MDCYTYTTLTGWTLTTTPALPPWLTDCEELSDWLYDHGYCPLAESGTGRCGVGHFYVWHQEELDPTLPRYALEVDQLDADCVVWCATLPDLWEFLAKYG